MSSRCVLIFLAGAATGALVFRFLNVEERCCGIVADSLKEKARELFV